MPKKLSSPAEQLPVLRELIRKVQQLEVTHKEHAPKLRAAVKQVEKLKKKAQLSRQKRRTSQAS